MPSGEISTSWTSLLGWGVTHSFRSPVRGLSLTNRRGIPRTLPYTLPSASNRTSCIRLLPGCPPALAYSSAFREARQFCGQSIPTRQQDGEAVRAVLFPHSGARDTFQVTAASG